MHMTYSVRCITVNRSTYREEAERLVLTGSVTFDTPEQIVPTIRQILHEVSAAESDYRVNVTRLDDTRFATSYVSDKDGYDDPNGRYWTEYELTASTDQTDFGRCLLSVDADYDLDGTRRHRRE